MIGSTSTWCFDAELSCLSLRARLPVCGQTRRDVQLVCLLLLFMHADVILVQDLDEDAFDNDVQPCTHFVNRPPLLEEVLKICHSIRAWIGKPSASRCVARLRSMIGANHQSSQQTATRATLPSSSPPPRLSPGSTPALPKHSTARMLWLRHSHSFQPAA